MHILSSKMLDSKSESLENRTEKWKKASDKKHSPAILYTDNSARSGLWP